MKLNHLFYCSSYKHFGIMCYALKCLCLRIHWHVGHDTNNLCAKFNKGKCPNIRLRSVSIGLGKFRWSKYGYAL